MKDKIKATILEALTHGMKGTKLVVDVVAALRDSGDIAYVDGEQILSSLRELVKSGEIIEIEYNTPDMPDRIKSFYLPKGSKVISISHGWAE
jgi:hypothetical protein